MGGPVAVLLVGALAIFTPPGGSGQAKMLILPVGFTDTSEEVMDQSQPHQHRRDLLAAELAGEHQLAELLSSADLDRDCPRADADCILALARQRGAERILVAEVVKTSTLILNLDARLIDVATNRRVAAKFISFRGDTDDAWRRTARFLAQQIGDARPTRCCSGSAHPLSRSSE